MIFGNEKISEIHLAIELLKTDIGLSLMLENYPPNMVYLLAGLFVAAAAGWFAMKKVVEKKKAKKLA